MPASRIGLLLTGGTIDSIGVDRLDLAWYFENDRRLAAGQLAARVPELDAIAQVEEIPFKRLSSGGITPADWLNLARTIQERLDGGLDGAVITHGTNTLEETAYFLNLTLNTSKPVVVTGAMRPSNALSGDGDLNLLNAFRVAASASAAGKGVLVLLNDTIHASRDVTKTNTLRTHTFQSRDTGPLGYADSDGRLIWYMTPARRHTTASAFHIASIREVPRVDVVVSYGGADGALIDAAVAAGAKGIVSAGTGAGRPTPLEDDALDRAIAQGVVVVQASRTGSGRVPRSPNMAARRLVTADDLLPWKARILLMLALTQRSDVDAIQQVFEEY
ncbi:MAG TPA: asparaginase [Chloroflexota bacterium]|nr:asparaginase [Chloroflexota bacterium]